MRAWHILACRGWARPEPQQGRLRVPIFLLHICEYACICREQKLDMRRMFGEGSDNVCHAREAEPDTPKQVVSRSIGVVSS